jgi:hypothetical protein
MRVVKTFVTGLVLLATGVAGITWFALEGRDVAVLRTIDLRGETRETRVWVASAEGALWLEAATPERPWYRDVLRNPRVELVYRSRTEAFVAQPEPGPEGHSRIRLLFRKKYGLADHWVGLFQSTSRSVAVRLANPAPSSPGA